MIVQELRCLPSMLLSSVPPLCSPKHFQSSSEHRARYSPSVPGDMTQPSHQKLDPVAPEDTCSFSTVNFWFCFVLGPLLAVLRPHSQFCAQGSLLEGLGRPYEVLEKVSVGLCARQAILLFWPSMVYFKHCGDRLTSVPRPCRTDAVPG